jgi:hypothetical protein
MAPVHCRLAEPSRSLCFKEMPGEWLWGACLFVRCQVWTFPLATATSARPITHPERNSLSFSTGFLASCSEVWHPQGWTKLTTHEQLHVRCSSGSSEDHWQTSYCWCPFPGLCPPAPNHFQPTDGSPSSVFPILQGRQPLLPGEDHRINS